MTQPHKCTCCGGHTEQKVADIDPKALELVKQTVASKGLTFVEVLSFKTQVVAGVNMTFDVKTTSGNHHMTIWRQLNGTLEVTNFQ